MSALRVIGAGCSAIQACNHASTARTRRFSSDDGGRSSFPKMFDVCLATARSVMTSCAAMAAFVELEDDPAMGPPGRWAVGDAFTHEADIRGSLGVERVPADAVALGLKGSIARWREVLGEDSMPTLLVRAPDLREWWIGTPDDPGAVVVRRKKSG